MAMAMVTDAGRPTLGAYITMAVAGLALLGSLVGLGMQIGSARQEISEARADLRRNEQVIEALRMDIQGLELYIRDAFERHVRELHTGGRNE